MVFGTLISAFNGNTTRYSQAARQYQPDWQRAFLKAGQSNNSGLNASIRASHGANSLLANSVAGSITTITGESVPVYGQNTSNAIFGRLGTKVGRAAQSGEQLAYQAALKRLQDPVTRLLKENNPSYEPQKLPPIPDFKQRTRNFLNKLREFQGSSGKGVHNPFAKPSARVNQEQAFGDESFLNATKTFNLNRGYYLRAAVDRGQDFIVSDVLDSGFASPGTPTHFAVKLHGGETGYAYDDQRIPYGKLQLYDVGTDTVIRELAGDTTEILTAAEFQQLRYIAHDESVSNKLDYLNYVALEDVDGNGIFDASDRRGSFEDVAIAINELGRNYQDSNQWAWRGTYVNEQAARFANVVLDLEGDFVGADALTDYQNGDLTIDVTEYGKSDNIAVLDEAASSGNKLIFRFDYAYDGIDLVAKYADNEVASTAISKVTTIFE